jgi:hypothetical protein
MQNSSSINPSSRSLGLERKFDLSGLLRNCQRSIVWPMNLLGLSRRQILASRHMQSSVPIAQLRTGPYIQHPIRERRAATDAGGQSLAIPVRIAGLLPHQAGLIDLAA